MKKHCANIFSDTHMTVTKLINEGCSGYCGLYDEDKVSRWEKVRHAAYGVYYQDDPATPPLTQVVYYPAHNDNTTSQDIQPGDVLLYLGEVRGMRGHGAFATRDGRTVWGYHTFNFRIIPGDEI